LLNIEKIQIFKRIILFIVKRELKTKDGRNSPKN
jgi:hypothetical protein